MTAKQNTVNQERNGVPDDREAENVIQYEFTVANNSVDIGR